MTPHTSSPAAGGPAAAAGAPGATPSARLGGFLTRLRTASPAARLLTPARAEGAGDAATGPAAGRTLPPPVQGYRVRRSLRRARRGCYAPATAAALTSTRQAEILNPALVAAPTDSCGIVIGRDLLSNALVAHDPFTAYERGLVSSPAVLAIGAIGSAKSSLLKTAYVMRPLALKARRVVVMDRKDRGGEGEYCELARHLGVEPLRFVVAGGAGGHGAGSGTRLNILDPLVLAGSGVPGQARLLIALAELANDGQALDKWEKAALRAAHTAALRRAEADGVVPVLDHLLAALGGAHLEFADHSPAAAERIHQAGLGVRHLLAALLADELAGLFDGPTSHQVALADRLTVFDISQLPDEGPAAAMVMAVANVWLLGVLRTRRGLRTNFIAEEGWDLVGGPGGRVFQRNSKLARGLGLSNVAALHHVADIPAGDPAIAMLTEAQTAHLYRQDRADAIDAVARLYDLSPGSRDALADLPVGHHLLKIGNRREIHVEHVRSRLEMGLTDTDAAMLTNPRQLTRGHHR